MGTQIDSATTENPHLGIVRMGDQPLTRPALRWRRGVCSNESLPPVQASAGQFRLAVQVARQRPDDQMEEKVVQPTQTQAVKILVDAPVQRRGLSHGGGR